MTDVATIDYRRGIPRDQWDHYWELRRRRHGDQRAAYLAIQSRREQGLADMVTVDWPRDY